MTTDTQSKILELQKKYNALMERRKFLWAEDDVVAAFNKNHAVIRIDQTYILTEKINAFGNEDFSLESRASFTMFYEDEMVACPPDGSLRSKADIWLKSHKRRKYAGIVFNPTTIGSVNGYYNMWKGFSRKSQQGDCFLFWEHVDNNICSTNEALYTYVRKWTAFVFQRPDEIHTALVLCGSQGVGKNRFVDQLGVLLGSHYAPLSSMSELLSNFNFHLKNAVLINANEALWGGYKKDIGTLKAMITDPICLIEGKGKDRIPVRNFKHIIMCSNEDWPVHIEADDRRFVVIRVSDAHKDDRTYFAALQEQLNNGGYEALLHDLLHEDLTGFDPRILPISTAAFDIKMRSAESTERYLYEVLCEGKFGIGCDTSIIQYPVDVEGSIEKKDLYSDYVAWCRNNGEQHILTNALFGKALKKYIPSIGEARLGGTMRKRTYIFPPLDQARKEFAKAFKENVEHIFGPDAVQE